MRRTTVLVVCAAVASALVVRAQEPAGQQPFRAGVDVVEIDVTVLDDDRQPVRDLEAADFEIFEDGTQQEIVSFTAVTVADQDPVRSARMRFATPDVAINNLADRVGGGRLFAIVLDDMNLPADDSDIVIDTRAAARRIVDGLGPSDQAAVVYARDAGNTQDYTSDQRLLYDAINRFEPRPAGWMGDYPDSSPGGDLPMRYSRALSRSPCMREQPAVPTLEAVTASLAEVPGRRKTILFLSVGLPVSFSGRDTCGGLRAAVLRDTFRLAQQASINIYTIDPAGYQGYRDYLRVFEANGANRGRSDLDYRRPTDLRQLSDFMKTVAENTGGRAIVDTDAVLPEIDRVFEEDATYYLIGYESSNGEPDGEFREIEVDVAHPDVTVRHRSGYWAPDADDVRARGEEDLPETFDPEMSGLTGPPGVPLRAVAAAIAPSPTAGREPLADVVVALSVGWPALRGSATDTLNIIRNVYDEEGRTGDPMQESVDVALDPGDEAAYHLLRRLTLPTGRHQVRFNVASTLLGGTGSVYVDVEVPRFERSALSLSGVVVGEPLVDEVAADPAIGGLVPLRPTTSRDFANGESIEAFVRVYQGGDGAPGSVTVTAEVLDTGDVVRYEQAIQLEPSEFEGDLGVPVRVPLPLSRLGSGPHLLSLTASLPTGRTTRREVLFRVR